MEVLFSVLSYYPSFITEESINVGLLFHDVSNDIRIFETTTNWNRLKSFDDEVNINYMKAVLDGIKAEVENETIFNQNENFNMSNYIKFYANELKFSEIAPTKTDSLDDFMSETKRMFLRFDYEKKDRPDKNQQLRYVKELLKSSKVDYSCKNIIGKYNENVQFDYIIDDYAFKLFTFENKKISNQMFAAKSWALTSKLIEDKYKTIFIYDIDKVDDPQYTSIMELLKDSSYKVLKLSEAMDFVLGLSGKENFVYNTIGE